MDVTVNINAPAIVEAINKLCEVIASVPTKVGALTVPETISAAPVQQIPMQNVAQPTVQPAQVVESTLVPPTNNAAQNVAPVQQAAVQQAAVQQTVTTAPAQIPAQVTQQAPEQQAAPAPAPAVDEAYRARVCTAAARLVEQGKMSDVLNALQSFGVPSVAHLTAAQLPEFVNKIVALGAVI